MTELVKARRKQKTYLLIHNDLFNVAHHFKETIERKERDEKSVGIALDCMACLVFLAFTVEAQLNLIGDRICPNWNERARFKEKYESIMGALNLVVDLSAEPHKTVFLLKAFRDTLAHGKPQVIESDETIVDWQDKIDRKIVLSAPWEVHCNAKTVLDGYNGVQALWKLLMEKSQFEPWETMTRGDGSLSIIEVLTTRIEVE